ncbi:MAG: hypothetical protein ACI4TI_00740 [Christensenellales bacterium]
MIKLIKENKDLLMVLTIIFIIVLSMLILSYTLAFFKSKAEAVGEITLGELDYSINIDYDFGKEIMPADDVEILVSVENKVKNKSNLVPFYFRFQILNGATEYNRNLITLFSPEEYVYGNSFWYYTKKVQQNEQAKLIKSIHISEDLTQGESEYFDLQILVEAVQSEYGAYKDVFDNAPSEWVKIIENN